MSLNNYDTIKENKLFKRIGSCVKCGKCCYVYDKPPKDGGKRIACKDLIDNGDGTFDCAIYETTCPQECKEWPILPFRGDDITYYSTCGYSFVVDDVLTYENAMIELDKLCNICSKDSATCPQRATNITEIVSKTGG